MKSQHAQLLRAMIAYNAGDAKRIQHLLKVHSLAATIGTLEGIDEETLFILETAAIVHDIGIRVCEKKYGSCEGKLQEKEGFTEARKLLTSIGTYREDQIERVCWLVAHHHTYHNISGMDYQILIEADFLVNIYEDQLDAEAIEHVRKRIFKTASGIEILDTMFGKAENSPNANG